MPVAGVLLAAGAGRRMGRPKALLRDAAGVPFLDRSIGCLLAGGCAGVTVVLGAASAEARALLADAGWVDDEAVDVVVADDWETGMGASLRTGLERVSSTPAGHGDARGPATARPAPEAVLVSLVDLPDVGPDVVRRVLAAADDGLPSTTSDSPAVSVLARAAYDGAPGHPVLIGRDHWAGVVDAARGDRGARDYLSHRPVRLVECGDLATGRDVDHPGDL